MEAGPLNESPHPPLPENTGVPVSSHPPPPVWVQRLLLVIEVGIAMWAGMLVLVLPWTRLWTENPLLASWPHVHHFLNLSFVRGMISGIGLIDVWMGVSDALTYRDTR